MGLAEITPGISGATVAGLFNVYNEFVRIISFFSPSQFEFSFKKIKENNKKVSKIETSNSFSNILRVLSCSPNIIGKTRLSSNDIIFEKFSDCFLSFFVKLILI